MKTRFIITLTSILLLCHPFGLIGQGTPARENESLARAFFQALNEHDVNALSSLFSEDCLYEEVASGRTFENRQAIAAYIGSTLSGIPDSKFEVREIAAGKDIQIVEWTWTGTNSVGWPNMGIPATDKYFELRGVSVMEIKNGQIHRTSDYWDWNSFIQGISE